MDQSFYRFLKPPPEVGLVSVDLSKVREHPRCKKHQFVVGQICGVTTFVQRIFALFER